MRPVHAGGPFDPARLTVPGAFRSITPMFDPTMPRVLHRGRWWSADELDAIARVWRAAALETIGDGGRLVATALPATPEGVALFVALTSLPSPVALLMPDARSWRMESGLPVGTPVVLPPSLAHLGPDAEKLGLVPLVLPSGTEGDGRESAIVPLGGPGIVLLTSGSTGLPRPIFRTMPSLLASVAARNRGIGLTQGAGILIGVSLSSGQGVTYLAASILLGGSLGLLQPIDHRAALEALAMPEFQCWRATPHFVDVLSRCALTASPLAPPVCILSSPISRQVFDAFAERFGVPLRQTYSSTETGTVAYDDAPDSAVRRETVGRALPGVEIRIGEQPTRPSASGEIGRIWLRSPWQMAGYGYPPLVEPPDRVDGWWPTKDLGSMDAGGYLTLHGRIDDCIRTRENRLVNLSEVAAVIRELHGVTDVVVLPLDGPAGATFGAVVQCAASLEVRELRTHVAGVLPPWSWPRVVEAVRSLPRLSNGKTDRQACMALLRDRPAE
jgi:acyl-CoA synthetase (AMP-forming)/AMP-acid ligase II